MSRKILIADDEPISVAAGARMNGPPGVGAA